MGLRAFTVYHLLQHNARTAGTAPAAIDAGRTLTHQQFLDRVDRLAADFFVMYFGVLANVTPPVALAAYAAAGIAHASPLQTCFTAVRLSVAGFLVPYIFVYSPVMLGVDLSLGPMIQIIITSTVGVVALGAAMEGYFLREATWYERLLLIAAAIDLIIPGLVTDLIGAALFALIVVSQRARAPLAVPTAQVAKQRVVPGEEDQARESHEAPFHR